MAHKTGWFSARQDDIIHAAGAWAGQVDLHGQARGIPQERITGFKNQPADTKALFAEVKPAGRNSVSTEHCRIAFREMNLAMQFMKANYINFPPRTAGELAALLLSVHDGSSTLILPGNVAPGLSLHNRDGHGILVNMFMNAILSDKRGLKPAGRWASEEEAAAAPRLLTRPLNQAADLPIRFSKSRKWHEPQFSLANARLGVCSRVLADAPVSGWAVLPGNAADYRVRF
ncbi:MAG: hypothetical protein LBD08_00305 [Treponema sp.]|jgi:hypothetical protein|nr:hypothetical protein [Treponema sp.]